MRVTTSSYKTVLYLNKDTNRILAINVINGGNYYWQCKAIGNAGNAKITTFALNDKESIVADRHYYYFEANHVSKCKYTSGFSVVATYSLTTLEPITAVNFSSSPELYFYGGFNFFTLHDFTNDTQLYHFTTITNEWFYNIVLIDSSTNVVIFCHSWAKLFDTTNNNLGASKYFNPWNVGHVSTISAGFIMYDKFYACYYDGHCYVY